MKYFSISGPFLHRNFRRLLQAHALSRFGTELALISVAFAVLQTSESVRALGLVLAARTLPNVVFLFFGGVWADRLPRANVMISSDLVCAIVQTALGVVVLTHTVSLWMIVLLQALLGSATAFFTPAAAGLIPATVPNSDLQRANGILGLAGNGASILSPAIAGGIVVWAGPGWSILIDAATFFGSAYLLFPLRGHTDRKIKTIGKPRRVFDDLNDGWQVVHSRPWMIAGIVQALLFQACFAVFFTLGPVVARSSLGGAGSWGILLTAFGAGSLVGGLGSLRLHARRPLLAMQFCLLFSTPTIAVLSLTKSLPILMVTTALAGAGFASADTLWETTLQRETPRDRLSRVAAFDRIGSSCLRPFGYLLAGSAAATLGQNATLRGSSVLLALSIPVVLLLAPQIREMRYRSVPSIEEDSSQETEEVN